MTSHSSLCLNLKIFNKDAASYAWKRRRWKKKWKAENEKRGGWHDAILVAASVARTKAALAGAGSPRVEIKWKCTGVLCVRTPDDTLYDATHVCALYVHMRSVRVITLHAEEAVSTSYWRSNCYDLGISCDTM